MGAREEVLRMLKEEGLSLAEIRQRRGVTLNTILGYLDQLVGRGQLRRSDIFFSVPSQQRHPIMERLSDGHSQNLSAVMARLERRGVNADPDDVAVIQRYWGAHHALGEMYEDIRTVEMGLHSLIRQAMQDEFGLDESGWWRLGIPKTIRQKCQGRREDDDLGPVVEPYCYTDLIDLREILKQQWGTLSRYLPKQVARDKGILLDGLMRLNQIRRLVMHPVRGGRPSEDDFEFVHSLKERLGFA